MFRAILLFVCLNLAGCWNQDDWFSNCLPPEGPEFLTDSLPSATLNEVYQSNIKVNITNNPLDDSYQYYFYVSGDLPEGLTTYQKAHERTLSIEGTPVVSGSFSIKVSVEVRDATLGQYQTADLCTVDASKHYTLVVNQI